eukprot:TRINITY_DN14086_c0_g1_i1.p1 TRINITY_DN14086_c0_g1~~TRINITY_DN14086_c0_g1_i1.p1  ORF type:complete len:457 (+),score=81.94 TRINITY_DN14086_c0_g1_i1:62-1432(+)
MNRLFVFLILLLALVVCVEAESQNEIVVGGDVEKRATGSRGSTTVTTRKSWFERVMDSFVAAAIGFGMFFFTFAILTANEGALVTRLRSIDRLEEDLRSTDPELGTRLFYTTDTVIGGSLSDTTFGVSTKALRIRRLVEMYQYHEETSTKTVKDTVGGGETTETTYTLKTGWFDYQQSLSGNAEGTPAGGNPSFPTLSGELVMSRDFTCPLTISGHKLSDSQISQISQWVPLRCEPPGPESISVAHSTHLHDQCSVYLPSAASSYGTFGESAPGLANIGDVRIKWEVVKEGTYTVLCGQEGTQLRGYRVPGVSEYRLPLLCYPCTCGIGAWIINMLTSTVNVIDVIRAGTHSSDDIVVSLRKEANFASWLLRVIGFFLFFISMMLILSPLPTILDIIGFVGDVARFGTTLISIAMASILTPLVIAVCWVAYRPLIAMYLAIPPFVVWLFFAKAKGL